ncbi:MAG: hypothetical protein HKO62_12905, partial [Gammaproteobacteria bacterium]|nr:hypothetical protein [Gammaproteobacteria bacterium]
MLRIFRHYVPKTLVLLGVAEILVLMVSILVGAVLAMDGSTTAPTAQLWLQALVFAGAMLLGMAATGLYQRHLRDAPVSTLLRLCLSFVIGFMAMGTIWLIEPTLVVGPPAFALALSCSFIGIASCRFIAYQNSDARMTRRLMVLGIGERAGQIDKLRRASDRE